MATTHPIKPLDGAGGYLRWKKSLLLRIRTLGVAHVLFEARPAGAGAGAGGDNDEAAAKKWARDDAVCRGHILATLSDRPAPGLQLFATAAELWRALARTYHLDTPRVWRDRFDAFVFEQGSKDKLLEQIAHAEALGVAAKLPDDFITYELCGKLPDIVSNAIVVHSGPHHNEMTMSLVWDVPRHVVACGPRTAMFLEDGR
ncbi:uncharacterized protein [Miscanthus floridulus]|uniref:uncharacterized protein n=1 Tax=Miscanthus floridulus TaxID=154761 RepID=UPI00345B2BB9